MVLVTGDDRQRVAALVGIRLRHQDESTLLATAQNAADPVM
jgi:hypothetical protein